MERTENLIVIDGERASWKKLGWCLCALLPRSVAYKCTLKISSRVVEARVTHTRSGELKLCLDEPQLWNEVSVGRIIDFRLENLEKARALFNRFQDVRAPSAQVDADDSEQDEYVDSLVQRELHNELTTNISSTATVPSPVFPPVAHSSSSVSEIHEMVSAFKEMSETFAKSMVESMNAVASATKMSRSLDLRDVESESTTEKQVIFHPMDIEAWKTLVVPLDSLQRRAFISQKMFPQLHGSTSEEIENVMDDLLKYLDIAKATDDSFWLNGGSEIVQKAGALLYFYSHKNFCANVRRNTFLEALQLDGVFQTPKNFADTVHKLEAKYCKKSTIRCNICKKVGHIAKDCQKNEKSSRNLGKPR